MNKEFRDVRDIPYTLSYVFRKRMQIDNLNELPKKERPPDDILWSDNPDDLEDWIEKVVHKKKKDDKDETFEISLDEIEG